MGKYKILSSIIGCTLIVTTGVGLSSIAEKSCNNSPQSATAYSAGTNKTYSASEVNNYFTKANTETSQTSASHNNFIDLKDNEIKTLATHVTLEAGVECYDCQKDVASVVINRMLVDDLTLDEVIYAENQFTPAYMISYFKPTETSLEAVNEVVAEGTTLPLYVTYFRSGWYHEWGNLVGYRQYENTYFSYDVDLKTAYENGDI